uniref:Predicted 3'-5' exonuclease PolB-like domain-containing protein n=1 Tax=candidate division CPR3 bacterium TaxID=2268181 RepID=A0A7C4LZH0_UNCC3
MSKLVFDIETIGRDWDEFDELTKNDLTRWLKKDNLSDEDTEFKVNNIKDETGLSPLTGEIVSVAIYDVERGLGAVYFQAPEASEPIFFEEGGIKYQSMTEAEILKTFWDIALKYKEFITFNGRGFDAPFIMIRSAINEITPSVDLMEGRYLYQQRGVKHLDIYDQMTFYGATSKKGSLHLFCRAFDIPSPKTGGGGNEVGHLFKEKKYEEIARYNMGDVIATKDLYLKWEKHLKLFH